MSVINKIPRGLRVLIVIAVLAVLVWKFATGNYLYPGIAAAIVITVLVIFAVYRTPRNSVDRDERKKKKGNSKDSEDSESLRPDENLEPEDMGMEAENDETGTGPVTRVKPLLSVRKTEVKPNATDVAAKYIQLSKKAELNRVSDDWQPAPKTVRPEVNDTKPVKDEPLPEEPQTGDVELNPDDNSSEPAVPIIEDETTLSIEDQNQLVNAVWYRCENPFCKHTRFLGVHHILDEKEGGTNKLDNLIVLCPQCHDLAHKKEIPEEEMQSWIANREERFKFKPDWPH
jgi:cell division protein FtsN